MKIIKNIFHLMLELFALIYKNTVEVDPEIIVFSSLPDYSDNSKALSDYLVSHRNYKIYWAVKNADYYKKLYPNDGVTFLSTHKLSVFFNLRIFIKAGWLFGTHGFAYYNKTKKQGQKYIKLWHGCGLKDADSSLKKMETHFCPNFDVILLSGIFFKKFMAPKWFWPEDKVMTKGFPRYDWLIKKEKKTIDLVNSIKGCNKFIVWMPTYRNHKAAIFNDNDDIKSFPILQTGEDWSKFNMYCKDRKIMIFLRLHPMQKCYDINWEKYSNIVMLTDDFLNNNGENLYSILSVSDALITDYSSVYVDYMIVGKPIAFTLDDFQQYDSGRGFIVDNPKDYMPGHHVYDKKDLYNFIDDVSLNNDPFKSKRETLFNTLVYKSNNYCKEIVEDLGL